MELKCNGLGLDGFNMKLTKFKVNLSSSCGEITKEIKIPAKNRLEAFMKAKRHNLHIDSIRKEKS